MRFSVRGLVCIVAILGGGSAAWAQTAQLTLVPVDPPSAVINPGQTVTFEVYVDDVADPGLRGYQAQLEISGGTSGTLELADLTPPPDNTALFVDATRSDYVFFGLQGFPGVNVDLLRISASVVYATDSVVVTQPKYCGTYVFQASGDALGTFQLNFTDPDVPENPTTFLRGPGGITDNIPVSVTGATVVVTNVPPNDDCNSPATITDGVNPFSTFFATEEGPDLPPACDEGAGTVFGPDTWYDYVATCTGPLVISTCGDANFDTRLAVYGNGSGTCACPTDNSNLIACNDDALGCPGFTSEVSLAATAGDCYTIRIGGAEPGLEGSGNLTIDCIGNDECASAEVITVPSMIGGTTANTNVDSVADDCGSPMDSPGVWFRFTGTGNHLTTASICLGTSYTARLSVYEGTCGSLSCVGDVDCTGSGEVTWCTTENTEYWLLVHGVGGESGSFTLNLTADDCDDSNECTQDSCDDIALECQYVDTTPAGQCCDPATGDYTDIDDGNPCTVGSCDPETGEVTQNPNPDPPPDACDDGLECTIDACIDGACDNTNINDIECVGDGDCPGDTTCGGSGFCVCVETPTLELVLQPGSLPVENCFGVGEEITIHLEMGYSPRPIVGGQFDLLFDASTLDFVSMVPGSVADPESPFAFQLGMSVDPVAGRILYGVGVVPGEPGTVEPATVAVVTFEVVAECSAFVLFPEGGLTQLFDEDGRIFDPFIELEEPPSQDIGLNASPPVVAGCPGDIIVSPDPGGLTAVVTWDPPTANDNCDGSLPVHCTPPSGYEFPAGTTLVRCTAQNSCGVEDECFFSVSVVPGELTVDLEYAPVMAPVTMQRCITFEVHDCVGGITTAVPANVTFTNGVASGAIVPMPTGTWDCITARDKLHSLRSTADDLTTSDGLNYSATFMGAHASGGHRLIGGDLNDDGWINVQDYVYFLQQYLQPLSADTPCWVPPLHADITGNSVVDVADLGHIQMGMFTADEPDCCGTGGGPSSPSVIEISIRELRDRNLGHLEYGDMDGDGKLNLEDINKFIEIYGAMEEAGQIKVEDISPEGGVPVKRFRGHNPRR